MSKSLNPYNCPVPKNQQPLYEYNALKSTLDFTWTQKNNKEFLSIVIQIFLIFLIIWTLILTNNHSSENFTFKQNVIIWNSSSLCTSIIITRYYLGWSYIYNRLMQGSITYEESGWYDGQVWSKTTEMLLQDRLVGTYEVLPTLQRLKHCIYFFILFIVIGLLVFKYIIK